MQQSNLIHLLKFFSAEEMKRFERFLASPYFNTSDKAIRFFKLLKGYYPDFNSSRLDKENVYAALYGKGRYVDQTMRALIADMLKLAKSFIQHEQLQSSELEALEQRVRWMLARNAEKFYLAEIELSGKLLEKHTLRDKDYYRHRWLHDWHDISTVTAQHNGAEHKLLNNFDITLAAHSLNRSYLINFFEANIFHLATAGIYNRPVDEELVKYIDLLGKNYINKGDIAIDIHYNSFQLLRTDEEEYFFELKEKFMKADKSIEENAIQNAGVTLENYCIRKIRQGEARFAEEIVKIFRFEAEAGICLVNGEINYIFYQNVGALGAETSQIDWVEDFVEKYKKYLPAEHREETYCYARAHVLFARKKYREALRHALASSTSYFFWSKILSKNLVARAQYELGMFEELNTELNTYKHHAKDEKISESRRQQMQVFVNTFRRLLGLNSVFSQENFRALKDYMETEKLLPNKKWFEQKLLELERKKLK